MQNQAHFLNQNLALLLIISGIVISRFRF